VRIVAERGAPEVASTRALLREADGVVFVADAAPSAYERNRRSLDAVREALAGRPDLPLVLQINKVDLPDAGAPSDVLEALDASSAPFVVAVANRNEGVCETAERALAAVLATLRLDGNQEASAAQATGPRVEGNPLLTSLREVLRETVAIHVAELESRRVLDMDERFRALGINLERAVAESPRARPEDRAEAEARAEKSAVLRARFERVEALLDSLHRKVDDLTDELLGRPEGRRPDTAQTKRS